ncbi:hypothetical protein R84B8_00095 [Treponema sp. R8-4-B8]
MKKYTVFLLAVLVFIAGIIFTSCDLNWRSEDPVRYCPYCNSMLIEGVEGKGQTINHGNGNVEKVYKCKSCGKEFGVFIWNNN